ncbi:flagellar protein G [Thermococcus sp. M39]|uniref:flagellar protein G n=1 Tax=unclassified Thermococcus TaxID=2627626 RepID=UPI00143A2E26|nr:MULTISPECIES: flagellar protein G [unclassified Thermococcus]NJE08874.1 flagellar protein G [Thermococcus sp. M39]NJE13536.1 flagellar protein G [Thermococcus sp. LS2]
MAAGGPASELIMFIVAVIIAGTVAGALAYVTNDIANGMKTKGEDLADQLKIDFAIVNDPENIPVSGTGPYNYTFYIKNIGRESFAFNPQAVQVFIDGNLVPPENLTFTDVNGNPITSLAPYELGQIIVTRGTQLSSGQHKITVVLENGKRRSLVFEI